MNDQNTYELELSKATEEKPNLNIGGHTFSFVTEEGRECLYSPTEHELIDLPKDQVNLRNFLERMKIVSVDKYSPEQLIRLMRAFTSYFSKDEVTTDLHAWRRSLEQVAESLTNQG